MIYKEQMVEQKDRRRKPATAEPHTVSEINALIPVSTLVLVCTSSFNAHVFTLQIVCVL